MHHAGDAGGARTVPVRSAFVREDTVGLVVVFPAFHPLRPGTGRTPKSTVTKPQSIHVAVKPPSTAITWPVTNAASSEAR